jgi:hypothetical protein
MLVEQIERAEKVVEEHYDRLCTLNDDSAPVKFVVHSQVGDDGAGKVTYRCILENIVIITHYIIGDGAYALQSGCVLGNNGRDASNFTWEWGYDGPSIEFEKHTPIRRYDGYRDIHNALHNFIVALNDKIITDEVAVA